MTSMPPAMRSVGTDRGHFEAAEKSWRERLLGCAGTSCLPRLAPAALMLGMTTLPSRVRPGVPTSGQFAATSHGESDLALLTTVRAPSAVDAPVNDHRFIKAVSAADQLAFDVGRAHGNQMTYRDGGSLQPGDTVIYKGQILDIVACEPGDALPGGYQARLRSGSGKGRSEGLITYPSGASAIVAERDDAGRAKRLAALVATTPAPSRETPIRDGEIDGWTPSDVRDHFGFRSITPDTRSGLDMYNPNARPPVSINNEIRDKVAGFRVSDMRTGVSLRVGPMRGGR